MAEIDLVVNEDQQALAETLREFFAEQAPLERLRSPQGSAGFDRKVWAGVAELGLPAMVVPEEHGGLGQTAREAWVMFTEAGRGLYGGPLLAGFAATQALLLSGDEEAQAAHLPGIADGSTVATLALDGDGGGRSRTAEPARSPGVEARTQDADKGEAWVLTGSKTAVIAGHVADLLLVTASTSDGLGVFAVSGEAEGVTTTELETLDLSRPLARVDLDAAPARRLAGADEATVAATIDRLLVALAAEQAGGAGACLDMSVEYAKTRTQFDRPIGQFQAVAHACVDMLARVERARATSQYAAAADAAGSAEFPVAARAAAAYCGKAFREVTTATIHVHGGTGFTWEHDAHLFHRRAWTAEHLFGSAAVHHAEVATRLGL